MPSSNQINTILYRVHVVNLAWASFPSHFNHCTTSLVTLFYVGVAQMTDIITRTFWMRIWWGKERYEGQWALFSVILETELVDHLSAKTFMLQYQTAKARHCAGIATSPCICCQLLWCIGPLWVCMCKIIYPIFHNGAYTMTGCICWYANIHSTC